MQQQKTTPVRTGNRARVCGGRITIWCTTHESMAPSCLVSTVQGGGDDVMVWRIISWHHLGPLVPSEHCLNTKAYLSIVVAHVHPCMTTVYPAGFSSM